MCKVWKSGKKEQTPYFVSLLEIAQLGVFAAADGLSILEILRDTVWLQATGHIDLKGVEVVNGDILEISIATEFGSQNVERGYIKWFDEEAGFFLQNLQHENLRTKLFVRDMVVQGTIIGNIHSHPELLK